MADTVVEAEHDAGMARYTLVRHDYRNPVDSTVDAGDAHLLDLCLTSRPPGSRGSFPQRWRLNRFERIGNVLMVPAGHRMRGLSERGRLTSLTCRLSPEAIAQWFETKGPWIDPWLAASLSVRAPSVVRLLTIIAAELRNPGLASAAMMELLSAQLAIELARYYGSIVDAPVVGGLAPWQTKLIDERLMDVQRQPTLSELADLCRISSRHLSRAFRTSHGISVGDHIEQCRMSVARRHLDGNASIKTIAHEMGFASPSAFSSAFRRVSGESPRHYRQRLGRTVD